jgi:hypothetical protein
VKGIHFMALGFFVLALIPGSAWAERGEVIETVGNGMIDWTQGILMAKGSGAPPREARNIAQARLMTERAALTDARRNLLEVLKGVRVDSSTRVENFMVKNDQIRLQAEGFIQGSVEVRRFRKYLSDGAIEITVAVDLAGDFLSLLLQSAAEARKGMEKPPPPAVMEPKPAKKAPPPEPPRPPLESKPEPSPSPPPVARPPIPPPAAAVLEKKPEPPPQPAVPVPEKKPEPPPAPVRAPEKPLPRPADLPPFTGVVLDARGLGMKPALLIRVLDEGGMELYRGQYVPQEKAAQNGLALFSRDLTAAQTNPRVGKNPLTVKGSKVNPANPSDMILAEENARKIAPYAQKGTFLEDCRVMVVLE